jgi:hypothetical protein
MSPGLDEAVVEAVAASIVGRAALCATSLSN